MAAPTCARASVGAQQRAIADGVDQPRDAPGVAMDGANRPAIEDGPALARHAQAVMDVGPRLALRERLEVIARGHALGELAQVGSGQELPQLRLPDENHLQELLARRLQIRQEPDLLQDLAAEILGLVDDDHRPPAPRVRVEQVAVERIAEHLEACGLARMLDVQLLAHSGQQLDGGEGGIEHHRHVHLGRQLLEQRAAHGGLAGADLAGELQEAAPGADAVEQMGERFPVTVRQVEIPRVGRDRERKLGEPEVGVVHGYGGVRIGGPRRGRAVSSPGPSWGDRDRDSSSGSRRSRRTRRSAG